VHLCQGYSFSDHVYGHAVIIFDYNFSSHTIIELFSETFRDIVVK